MWLIVLIVVVVAAALVLVVARRGRRPADGVAGFQRHMSALSSDARREVIGRVEPSQAETPSEVDPHAERGHKG